MGEINLNNILKLCWHLKLNITLDYKNTLRNAVKGNTRGCMYIDKKRLNASSVNL
jgi:hypothetical protein